MKVLLADDDRVSRRLVQGHLESAGYAVVTADDGVAALKAALSPDAPRLFVLDWMMPGMNGPEIIQKLRRAQPELYRYAIILTQRDTAADMVSGFASGADDYVRKPCNPPELIARVRVGERILGLQERLAASNEALTRLANRDPLTDLANRRSVFESLAQATQRTRASHLPLGVAMIDIDHFKRVNDVYGHAVGDRVICVLAERLTRLVRGGTAIGRIGGEEFVLVEPEVDVDTLRRIAERLCETVRSQPIATPDAEVHVTVSIGIAWRSAEDPSTDTELLGRADAALYEAKRTGRDRVCGPDLADPMPRANQNPPTLTLLAPAV